MAPPPILNPGVRTKTITHTTKASAVTTAVAIAANASRRWLYLENDDGTDDIYIKFGVAAVDNEGIKIAAGAHKKFSNANGNLDTRVVNLISSANTPLLLIAEAIEEA